MKRYLIALTLVLFSLRGLSQEVDGAALFTGNCAACHTIGSGKLLGPDLKGIGDRRDRDWIIGFIRNSQQMIADGDEQAVKVFQENNMIPMAGFDFSDEQMKALLDFIIGNEPTTLSKTENITKPVAENSPSKVEPSEKLPPEPKNENQPNRLTTPTSKDSRTVVNATDQNKGLPRDQRKAIARSMMTGFMIAFIAAIVMVIGAYYSMRR